MTVFYYIEGYESHRAEKHHSGLKRFFSHPKRRNKISGGQG